ncbi:ABC transporter permease [Streptomyces sp. NPDC056480]|uniref:ABC transporter permease n=1 Tax=Streptomyces sp. NPDC056480 TaxID=3345833 RepID=UPI0036B402A5
MNLSRPARIAPRTAARLGSVVIYLPLMLVLIRSLSPNQSVGQTLRGLTSSWEATVWTSDGAWQPLWVSAKIGLAVTMIALAVGSLIAFIIRRRSFFGRKTIPVTMVLLVTLPGIVTGVALSSALGPFLTPVAGPGLFMIIVGHAICYVVVIFNNISAYLRQLTPLREAAEADLSAPRIFRNFQSVAFPALRSAVYAGGLLAFAVSCGDALLGTFVATAGPRTLPLWISASMTRPLQAPIVNVEAAMFVLLCIVPVCVARKLSLGRAGDGHV